MNHCGHLFGVDDLLSSVSHGGEGWYMIHVTWTTMEICPKWWTITDSTQISAVSKPWIPRTTSAHKDQDKFSWTTSEMLHLSINLGVLGRLQTNQALLMQDNCACMMHKMQNHVIIPYAITPVQHAHRTLCEGPSLKEVVNKRMIHILELYIDIVLQITFEVLARRNRMKKSLTSTQGLGLLLVSLVRQFIYTPTSPHPGRDNLSS